MVVVAGLDMERVVDGDWTRDRMTNGLWNRDRSGGDGRAIELRKSQDQTSRTYNMHEEQVERERRT